jgi:hypothetical protein
MESDDKAVLDFRSPAGVIPYTRNATNTGKTRSQQHSTFPRNCDLSAIGFGFARLGP